MVTQCVLGFCICQGVVMLWLVFGVLDSAGVVALPISALAIWSV